VLGDVHDRGGDEAREEGHARLQAAPQGEAVARYSYRSFPGRLAQLGERRLDKAEVTGSSPVSPIWMPAIAGISFIYGCQSCQGCPECSCGAYLGAWAAALSRAARSPRGRAERATRLPLRARSRDAAARSGSGGNSSSLCIAAARQAEALAAYQRARHRFEVELGLGPGEPLAQLQRRVRRSDGLSTDTGAYWSAQLWPEAVAGARRLCTARFR
jgi:Bacterial transcriptional activator domain